MNTLFELEEEKRPVITQTCRNCRYKFSTPLNEWSRKVLQCCEYKKGRNNAGYKTIKVTDTACMYFEIKTKRVNENR